MNVQFAESALLDLENTLAYYEQEGVRHIGQSLVQTILRRIEQLAFHPEIGRVVSEFQQVYIRELIEPPFRIVYFRENTLITIVRVWRSERILELPEQN
jgi:plasmid stabilization system protein ParE